MATKTKRGSDIKPGDVVIFLGTPHLIERIDPPTEATLSFHPTCLGYAMASDGWGISISPRSMLEVA